MTIREETLCAAARIIPQSGCAFRLRAGEMLTVIDPHGEQVADLVAFCAEDAAESLSSGRSIDYASTVRLTTGHVLYSNRSRPMFTIDHDDVGRHDFLLTPCSRQTFEIIYGTYDPHPSCLGNLSAALGDFGIAEDAIPVSFNIFMNVDIAADGAIRVLPPRSKAGDRIALPAEMSNNYAFKPIDYTITRAMQKSSTGTGLVLT
jgi:uncharacterized protein YcgI (DUF1989 family)